MRGERGDIGEIENIMKYDIFVSYRRSSSDTANLIAEKLRGRGYNVFFDVESLRGGKFNQQLFDVIEEVHLGFIVGHHIFVLLLTEKVYNQIVSDASEPSGELSVFGISTLLDGDDGLHEGFLKNVFSQLIVAYRKEYIGIQLILVSLQQNIKSLIVAF